MQVLVYIDQDDKDAMNAMIEAYTAENEDSTKARQAFWHGLIDKYPILKNRRLGFNAVDGYVFQWESAADCKYNKLGRADVFLP